MCIGSEQIWIDALRKLPILVVLSNSAEFQNCREFRVFMRTGYGPVRSISKFETFSQDKFRFHSRMPGFITKIVLKTQPFQIWTMLEQTFADADYDSSWKALFTMSDLFRRVALSVAAHFGFEYPHEDDQRVTAHLEHVRFLPQDVKDMY